MNSRERFLAVLDGKMPDRVPVTLFIADQGHFHQSDLSRTSTRGISRRCN